MVEKQKGETLVVAVEKSTEKNEEKEKDTPTPETIDVAAEIIDEIEETIRKEHPEVEAIASTWKPKNEDEERDPPNTLLYGDAYYTVEDSIVNSLNDFADAKLDRQKQETMLTQGNWYIARMKDIEQKISTSTSRIDGVDIIEDLRTLVERKELLAQLQIMKEYHELFCKNLPEPKMPRLICPFCHGEITEEKCKIIEAKATEDKDQIQN